MTEVKTLTDAEVWAQAAEASPIQIESWERFGPAPWSHPDAALAGLRQWRAVDAQSRGWTANESFNGDCSVILYVKMDGWYDKFEERDRAKIEAAATGAIRKQQEAQL